MYRHHCPLHCLPSYASSSSESPSSLTLSSLLFLLSPNTLNATTYLSSFGMYSTSRIPYRLFLRFTNLSQPCCVSNSDNLEMSWIWRLDCWDQIPCSLTPGISSLLDSFISLPHWQLLSPALISGNVKSRLQLSALSSHICTLKQHFCSVL